MDFNVMFGQYDTDVILEYKISVDFRKYEIDSQSVFYDELEMVTTGQVVTKQDSRIYIEILSHKLDFDNKYAQTSFPEREHLGVTQNDYREFLTDFNQMLSIHKGWFNSQL